MKYFIHFLTFFRIVSAPIIFILITFFHFYGFALVLFLLSSLSDYWDGFFARRYNLESVFGAILDPIADKILVTFLIFAFSIEFSSLFIAFIGGLILAREFWVSALRDLNAREGNSNLTKVTFLAKLKTATQFISFFGFLFGLFINNTLIIFISNFFLFLALIITLQTGLSYTIATFKRV